MPLTPREQQLENVRQFLRGYHALKRKDCTDVQWIMLKLSCSQAVAQQLIAAADPTGRTADGG